MGKTRVALWALGVFALAWRIWVFIDLRNSPLLSDAPTQNDFYLLIARGAMGLIFITCGFIVLHQTNRKRASVFALYTICAGIHWGGPFDVPDATLQTAVWLGYFLISGILAESAFLQFTLVFPEPWEWGAKHVTRMVIYAPVALGVVAATVALTITPKEAAQGWIDKFMLLEGLQTIVYPAIALVFLLVRFIRATPWDGPRNITGILVAGAWGSVLPWVITSLVEQAGGKVVGGSDIYTLFFVLLPITFTYAILRHNPVFSTGTAY